VSAQATHAPWAEIPPRELRPGITLRVVGGEHVMLAYLEMGPGIVVATHAHENEQISHVLEGRVRFWHGDDEEGIEVEAGAAFHVAPNVPHGAETLERTVILDIFAPPREDWLAVVNSPAE
jgi:quercetin dioxygenase-like cupin family protein